MVYDPSAKSRSASGVFPLGFPFTITSASAGVDRTSTRPGLGALGALGAPGLSRRSSGGAEADEVGAEAEGAGAGKSTIVASTSLGGSVGGTGVSGRRKNPTDNAARIAKTRNMATIGQRRLGSGSTSLVCSARGGCGDHDEGKAGGGAGSGSTLKSGISSRSRSCDAPRSMMRSKGSSIGTFAVADLKVGTTIASAAAVVVLAFRPAPVRSASAKSPARCGRTPKARPSSVPCSASKSFRFSAENRLPVAASNAIAPSE